MRNSLSLLEKLSQTGKKAILATASIIAGCGTLPPQPQNPAEICTPNAQRACLDDTHLAVWDSCWNKTIEPCEAGEICQNKKCIQPRQLPLGTIPQENTIYLPQNNLQTITQNTLTFKNTPGAKPGSILFGNDRNGLPYLRKITTFTNNGTYTTTQTSQASLTEAFETGDFRFNEKVHFANPNHKDVGSEYNFIILKNGIAEIGGSVEWNFSPDIDGEIKIKNGKLEKFRLTLEGELDLDAKFYADIEGLLTTAKEIALGSIKSPPIVFPPVYIQPNLIFFAGVEVSSDSSGSAYFSAHEKIKVNVSVKRENNLWSVPSTASASSLEKIIEFEIPSSAGITGYIKEELSFELYDFAGPTISLREFLDLSSELNSRTPELDVDWALRLGLDGTAGIRTEVLGLTLIDKELSLPFQLSKVLASGTYVISTCVPNYSERCNGSSVLSYDSCGRFEFTKTNCVGNTPYCLDIYFFDINSGTNTESTKCVECLSDNHCSTSESCIENKCTPKAPATPVCTPYGYEQCFDNNVWWFDTCEDSQTLIENCQGDTPVCININPKEAECIPNETNTTFLTDARIHTSDCTDSGYTTASTFFDHFGYAHNLCIRKKVFREQMPHISNVFFQNASISPLCPNYSDSPSGNGQFRINSDGEFFMLCVEKQARNYGNMGVTDLKIRSTCEPGWEQSGHQANINGTPLVLCKKQATITRP
ncbi:MAG: hypothetical protein ABIG28_01615 [archaeon]